MRTLLRMAIILTFAAALRAQAPVRPVVTTPPQGTMVIVGGGRVGPEILTKFFELAGGKDAPLVVIPTASGAESYPPDWNGLRMFKTFGATNITLLHTKDPAIADSEEFVTPLTQARAVWFPGGRQWHLVDSYLRASTPSISRCVRVCRNESTRCHW